MGRGLLSRRALAVGMVAALALAGAACGDDDDDGEDASATTTTEGDGGGEVDVAEYCDTFFAIEAGFNEEEPDAEEISPLIDDLEASHPEEVDEHLAVMIPAARDLLEDDSSGVETEEFVEARNQASAFNIENCETESGQVQTIDYGFVGIPTEIPAGRQIVEITNDGAEIHEMVLIRKNDGETMSFTEIFELGEEAAQEHITLEGFEFVGLPGSTGHLYADLEPGNYAAACFIPVGATDFETLQTLGEDAPPHFTQGMVAEFTVG